MDDDKSEFLKGLNGWEKIKVSIICLVVSFCFVHWSEGSWASVLVGWFMLICVFIFGMVSQERIHEKRSD